MILEIALPMLIAKNSPMVTANTAATTVAATVMPCILAARSVKLAVGTRPTSERPVFPISEYNIRCSESLNVSMKDPSASSLSKILRRKTH